MKVIPGRSSKGSGSYLRDRRPTIEGKLGPVELNSPDTSACEVVPVRTEDLVRQERKMDRMRSLFLRLRKSFFGRRVKMIRVIQTLRRSIGRSVWEKMENQTLGRGSVGLMQSFLVA